jgi:murein tripeptide amidase MpaA
MTVEYLAYQMVSGYKANDATFRSWLDTYDFYILPVVNPDGFVFSQTTNRM